jgi:predicted nuclease with TOPRIM domain
VSLEYLQIGSLVINLVLVLVILPIRTSIDKLQASDADLIEKVQRLEVEVAKNYARRGEVESSVSRIEHKIDELRTALRSLDHQKQDKS